jgi:hypothetical protein
LKSKRPKENINVTNFLDIKSPKDPLDSRSTLIKVDKTLLMQQKDIKSSESQLDLNSQKMRLVEGNDDIKQKLNNNYDMPFNEAAYDTLLSTEKDKMTIEIKAGVSGSIG